MLSITFVVNEDLKKILRSCISHLSIIRELTIFPNIATENFISFSATRGITETAVPGKGTKSRLAVSKREQASLICMATCFRTYFQFNGSNLK